MTLQYKRSPYMDDAVLNNLTSLGVPPNRLVSNVARSGQLGSGIRIAKLDGATPAVFNPVVAIVLTVPTMWDKYPSRQEFLKALMETHAKSITGIDFSYSLETADTPVGHDGQTMKVPTRTTRSSVSPSASFVDYVGSPVWNLFRNWMFDINHPDTNMSQMSNWGIEPADIPAWCMSAYSMSMLFIQYDPTGLPDRIEDAFVIVDMFPTDIGEGGYERTIGTTKMIERSVSFTGLVQHNENTRALGINMARMLQLHRVNYQFALPGLTSSADPDIAVQKELQNMGGFYYETNGVVGAREQFKYLGEGNYDNILEGDKPLQVTGAAKSDLV